MTVRFTALRLAATFIAGQCEMEHDVHPVERL
jgi:hypothetical protein